MDEKQFARFNKWARVIDTALAVICVFIITEIAILIWAATR